MCMPQTFDVAFLILLSLKSSKYVTPAEFNITLHNSRVTIFNFVISGLHSRYPKNMIAEQGCHRRSPPSELEFVFSFEVF